MGLSLGWPRFHSWSKLLPEDENTAEGNSECNRWSAGCGSVMTVMDKIYGGKHFILKMKIQRREIQNATVGQLAVEAL